MAKVAWLRDEDISEGEVARKLLGMSLSPSQTASSISVVDVAAVTEKPGVQTPSRKECDDAEHDANEEIGQLMAVQEVTKASHGRRRHPPPPIPPMLMVNGGKGPSRKMPPKAPPRRRTRLKTMASLGTLDGTEKG